MTADREKLHRAFFHVSAKHPKIMSLFSFRQREIFPESVQLDQALSNLDATGLISRQNVTPNYYSFEEPLKKGYEKFSGRILVAAGIDEIALRNAANDITAMIQDT